MGDINSFFTSEEAWAWQENFYRYIIARWGYSPAIGMWQTVSEINGTNAYDQTDPWHKKVNDYFVANDPYRHPTTASKSGGGSDIPWPEGHRVMDAPQVHIYDPLNDNPVGAASVLARMDYRPCGTRPKNPTGWASLARLGTRITRNCSTIPSGQRWARAQP